MLTFRPCRSAFLPGLPILFGEAFKRHAEAAQVGATGIQVGENDVKVGENGPQVGAKYQAGTDIPNVFSVCVKACRLETFFAILLAVSVFNIHSELLHPKVMVVSQRWIGALLKQSMNCCS